ncbi:MAG: ABC transporter substrate-binding protein, partial [Gemmatimonadetes bacterium]|nr:ABC transporter substrate-binding protein [Gemmatimonadota bacterium]
GRRLRLDASPRRIVSLSPATTELLFDLGAGDRVVGRTRWCEDPPAALAVPSVGDGFAPNVEAILAREPDLVVFYHTPSNAAAVARLEAMGIATVSLRIDRIADFERAARLLGRVLRVEARADSLVAALNAGLDSVSQAAHAADAAHAAAPVIAVIAWDNPPIVIGSTSFLSEIVTLAGGRNAFDDVEQPSLTVSVETIAARDPDLLLVHTDDSLPAFLARPEWQVVGAVRQRRLARVHGTEFSHPSFRVVRAVAHLRGLLTDTAKEGDRGRSRGDEGR